MKNAISAGSSSVDITPAVGCYLQGYTRGQRSTGIHANLHATATVFSDGITSAALITADLVGLDASQVGAIRAQAERLTGIPAENVMVNASHTHAGPTVQGIDRAQWGSMWGNPGDAGYSATLLGKLADAVRIASERLRPVNAEFGIGEVDFNVNRRRTTATGTTLAPNPGGVVDHRVKVLKLVDAAHYAPGATDVNPATVIMHFACHPTIMAMENLEISPDFPGVARVHVERTLSGELADSDHLRGGKTVAHFAQGCCGDVRPNLTTPDGLEFRPGTKQDAENIGRVLGSEVARVCDQTDVSAWDPVVRVVSRRISLPYSTLPDVAKLEDLVVRGNGVSSAWHLDTDGTKFGEVMWAKLALERMRNAPPPPQSISVEIQGIRIGDLSIVGIAGETFTEIGCQIEESAPGPVMMLGITNGNAGYICTEESYAAGGYEPDFSWMLYTHPAPFQPTNEQLVVEAGRAIVADLFR